MVSPVVSFHPDDPIDEAIDVMVNRGFSGAPVTTGCGQIVGILSEYDCMKLVAEGSFHHEEPIACAHVRDVMSPLRASIAPQQDLFAVVHCFLLNEVRRLPVVEMDRLVGLVSRRDVLRAIRRYYP